jgi:hypothetical protein
LQPNPYRAVGKAFTMVNTDGESGELAKVAPLAKRLPWETAEYGGSAITFGQFVHC